MKVKLYLTALLLVLGLGACQDKVAEDVDPNKTESSNDGFQGENDLVEIWDTEMAIDPKNDFSRGVAISFDERQTSTENTPLFYPRMLFKANTPLPATVILRHAKGGKETFRIISSAVARVTELLDNGRRAKFKISASYTELKRVVVSSKGIFSPGEDWHGMIILNRERRALNTNNREAVFGENPEDKAAANLSSATSLQDRLKYLANQNAGGSLTKGSYVITASWLNRSRSSRANVQLGDYDIPLISEWVKLEVKSEVGTTPKDKHILFRIAYNVGTDPKTQKKINRPLHVKPQGMLMTYNLAVDVHQGIYMRRAGIVSNAVDFQGKYLLTDAALKKAFAGRNSNGYGIPEWVGEQPDAERLQKLKMYTPMNGSDPGMRRQRDPHDHYPWYMPQIADAFTETGLSIPSYMQEMTGTMADASVAVGFIFAHRMSLANRPEYVVGDPMGATPHHPSSWYDGTRNDEVWRSQNLPNYGYYVQWAMPRKGKRLPPKDKRFTYFWVDANSAHSVDDYYRKPSSSSDVVKNGFNPKDDPEDYLRFLQKNSVRTQPMVVVHQTDADFSGQEGKTPHLYATLTTDLMITEVMHLDVDGKNYSVVEIHNPTMREIDLSNYLLYRMRIDDNKGGEVKLVGFSFPGRRDTSMEITDLDPAQTIVDPFMFQGVGLVGGKLRSDSYGVRNEFKPDETTSIEYNPQMLSDPEDKKNPRELLNIAALNKGRRFVRSVGTQQKPTIGEGQSILVGAAGYKDGDQASKIIADLMPKSKYDKYYGTQYRLRHFTWTTSKVFNHNYREGFILVRVCTDKSSPGGEVKYGDLKIIDATMPLPGMTGDNYGFAGTLAQYKAEYAKLKNRNFYVQRRADGVVFPFMPPYRTTRVNKTAWSDDWILESGTITNNPSSGGKEYRINHTLGYREMPFIYGDQGANTSNFPVFRARYFRLEKTPLDPACDQCRKDHRPVHR